MTLFSSSVGDSNGSHVMLLVMIVLLVSLLFLTYLVLHKVFIDWHIIYFLRVLCESIFDSVPSLNVPLPPAPHPNPDSPKNTADSSPSLTLPSCPDTLQCYDPGTNEWIGSVPALTPAQVHHCCHRAATAQRDWARTTFAQRRRVLRTLQQYILEHVHDICLVASLDSGKPVLDALLGEVLTTCEKIRTLQWNGELWLQPQYRATGPLMLHKTAMVEYVPLGVLATIAPWNYPYVLVSLVWFGACLYHVLIPILFSVACLLSFFRSFYLQIPQLRQSHSFGSLCGQCRGRKSQ